MTSSSVSRHKINANRELIYRRSIRAEIDTTVSSIRTLSNESVIEALRFFSFLYNSTVNIQMYVVYCIYTDYKVRVAAHTHI